MIASCQIALALIAGTCVSPPGVVPGVGQAMCAPDHVNYVMATRHYNLAFVPDIYAVAYAYVLQEDAMTPAPLDEPC